MKQHVVTPVRLWIVGLVALGAVLAPSSIRAANITNGFTFSVASGGGANATGSHFHSSSGGVFGNPAGKAEVGNYGGSNGEEVRGLSEYNLTGLASGTAFVTFNTFRLGGLFTGTNDFPFNGTINVFAYQGNNAEDISDYQAASLGQVGSFSTAGLTVGSVLSFDISSIYNTILASANKSLGIRLQIAPGTVTGGGALTFDTFRLTSTSEATVGVPEPASLGMVLIAGTFGSAYAFRRRRAGA